MNKNLEARIKYNREQYIKRREAYSHNPKMCICGTVLKYEKRYNDFCSLSCSSRFFNSKRVYIKNRKKFLNCSVCDKKVEVSIHQRKKLFKCKSCKEEFIKKINDKNCPICGEKNCADDACRWCANNGIKALKKIGVNLELLGTASFISDIKRVAGILYDQYVNEGMSSSMISKIYSIHDMTVLRIIKKFYPDFKTRSHSDAVAIAYNKGRLNHKIKFFKSGWHMTWDGREVFLRSGAEFRYAKLLDSCKIYYKVESLIIPYLDSEGNARNYIPDFYIPSENRIVEIKGSYFLSSDAYLKLEACKSLGYKTELKIY